MKRAEAFKHLQPICVNLVKSPSIEGLESLKVNLRDIDKGILKEIHEYILFPLRLIIKQKTNLNEKIITQVCQCTTTILSCTTITKWETFQDIFVTYTIMLSSPENPNNLSPIHEELKLAIVEVINTLVKNTDYSLALNQLYTAKNIPILGHTVSLLLYLIQDEKLRNLRILAMDCLVALSLSENTSIQVKITSGSIFASFLPRISTVLCSVITGDSTQGHFVTKKAIETWQTFLFLIMDDKLLKKSQKAVVKLKADAGNGKLQDLIVTRDSEWIKNTSDKLGILVQQVGTIKHSSWRVRLSLLDWAHNLLTNCSNSMSSSIPVLLEVLVILSCDTYSNISSKSKKALKQFQEQSEKQKSRPLMEILEENLLSMATTLPRQIRTSDDDQKLSLIKIISGYLKILGPNMNSLLHSYSHLKRFSLALIQALEMDCSSVKIVEEQTQILGHGASAINSQGRVNVHQPRKTFRHFHNDSIYQELVSLLQLLGHYGDLNLLVDHFLGLFHETSLNRLQATLIINQIMLGTIQNYDELEQQTVNSCDRQQELQCIISSLIDEYLSPNNFNLITSHVAKEAIPAEGQFSLVLYNRTQPTFYDYNANILQICLFLEGFAVFAKILQKDFNPFLITVLYPMLEKLGDCSAYLSNTAYLALNSISDSCGYKDIEDLIQQNIDYLINSITLRLRHLPQNPHAPIVLKVILQFGHQQLLPLIQDTITNILECLDDYQTIHVTTFMQVLHELCCAVRQWFPSDKETVQENNPAMSCVEEKQNSEDTKWLVDFLVQYHKDKKTAAGEIDDDDDLSKNEGEMDWTPASPTENEMENIEDEEKTLPPNHVTIIVDVMSRVKHLLSSEDVHLKLVVLDTITAAVYSLQSHQDHLLPMVHQLWTPLSQRFSDTEIIVRIKAIQTLLNISVVCGSFIRKRTTKEVFPRLCNFLKSQSKLSHNCGIGYSFTHAYKMQCTILDSLGNLCTNLGIQGKEVDDIATACIPYLSVHGHPELKKAALKTFDSLIAIEPDAMWLKLSYIYSPNVYESPAPMFQKVQFDSNNAKEYSNSIEVLFKNPLLQSKTYQPNVN